MTIRYPVIITSDDNGTYLVTCPILPIVVTYGESWQRALANAVDAIETALQV